MLISMFQEVQGGPMPGSRVNEGRMGEKGSERQWGPGGEEPCGLAVSPQHPLLSFSTYFFPCSAE